MFLQMKIPRFESPQSSPGCMCPCDVSCTDLWRLKVCPSLWVCAVIKCGINKTKGTCPFTMKSWWILWWKLVEGSSFSPWPHDSIHHNFYEDLWTEPAGVKMSISPPRVSLFSLTFNPALVGGVTLVHHFKDSIQCGWITVSDAHQRPFYYGKKNPDMDHPSLVQVHWMLSLRDHTHPLHISFTSPPPPPIPLHHPLLTHPSLSVSLSPRWSWGRHVWNVIGIIPFSLIASAREQSYVSHRMLTQPLRTRSAHTEHRNLHKWEARARAFSTPSRAFLSLSVLTAIACRWGSAVCVQAALEGWDREPDKHVKRSTRQ